jgi:tetratricopeptide (TPR) repeat protein
MEAETTQPAPAPTTFDFDKFLIWLHANRKRVATIAVAVLAVGGILGIVIWRQGQVEVNANEDFFALPSAFGSEKGPHPTPDALLKVAQEYPKTSVGEQSQFLAAGIYFTDGKYEQAYSEFSKFTTEHVESPLLPQAHLGMAASLEAQQKYAEAIQKYENVVTTFRNDSVVGPAKLTLARLYEDKNENAKALEYYDQLIKTPSGPYDPWAGEARERRDLLLNKHPELDPNAKVFSVTTPAAPTNAAKTQVIVSNAPASAPAPTIEVKPK